MNPSTTATPSALDRTPPAPLRPRPTLGLGKLLIGKEEEALLLEVVRSKHLFRYTYDLPAAEQGKMTATLEKEFREMMGAKYALAVTSGTAALEVALGAMGVGAGDEVIIPAWSWISCFSAVVRVGALPVLAELNDTFCLAAGEITRLTTPRTKAVIVVHYQGVAADMDPILEEARKAGIRVLEDCAESPGALYQGKRVGSMGDMGIYSFQYQKTMTSGEGGMLVTSDPLLYERAVRMHDLGLLRAHHALFVDPTVSPFCGAQYRMNEMTAAVALAQLRKLDTIRSYCRELSCRILSRIADLPGLELRRIPDPTGDSGFEIYFCLPDQETTIRFKEMLDARSVISMKMTGTQCHYGQEYCRNRSTHAEQSSPFRDFKEWPAPGYRMEDFPRTESLVRRFVAIPLGVLFTEEDADHIAQSIIDIHSALGVASL